MKLRTQARYRSQEFWLADEFDAIELGDKVAVALVHEDTEGRSAHDLAYMLTTPGKPATSMSTGCAPSPPPASTGDTP